MAEDNGHRGTAGNGQPGDRVRALARSLRPAVERVLELQAKARDLGLFVGDRDLLRCPQCGLMEDVLIDGRLITCWRDGLGQDAGLRFIEHSNLLGRFSCPGCGRDAESALDRVPENETVPAVNPRSAES